MGCLESPAGERLRRSTQRIFDSPDNIGNYGYTSVVSTGQNYTFGPGQIITNGSVALGASNPDLKWETSTQTNIGLDMEFFNSRLQVITDYYIKKTSDMLYAIPVLSTAGTAPPTQNVATAVNKGFEFGVNYAGGAGSAIRYNIGGNITFSRRVKENDR